MRPPKPMNLVAYTLKPPTGVSRALVGCFLEGEEGEEEEELLALVRGVGTVEIVQVLTPPPPSPRTNGKEGTQEAKEREGNGAILHTLCSQPTFSAIRAWACLRPVGGTKDLLAVTSDAGMLALVELVARPAKTASHAVAYHLQRVASLLLGTSGCARSVPGQYVAADPSGRAVMVSSMDGHLTCAVVLRNAATGAIELRRSRVGGDLGAVSGQATVLDAAGAHVGVGPPRFLLLVGGDEADGARARERARAKEEDGLSLPEESLKHVLVLELDLETNTLAPAGRLPVSSTGSADRKSVV